MRCLKVGDIVQVDYRFLRRPTDSNLGLVYNIYPDLDLPNKYGRQIIMESGKNLGGFSFVECGRYVKLVVRTGFNYDFKNVIKLDRDYEEGTFKPIFSLGKSELHSPNIRMKLTQSQKQLLEHHGCKFQYNSNKHVYYIPFYFEIDPKEDPLMATVYSPEKLPPQIFRELMKMRGAKLEDESHTKYPLLPHEAFRDTDQNG